MTDVFIDPSASADGSGSIGSPRNRIPTIVSGTNYYIKRGTRVTQSAVLAISALSNVLVGSYGQGEYPILDGQGGITANFTIANSTGITFQELACIRATNVNGVTQVSGTSDNIKLRYLVIAGVETCVLVSGAGCTNVILEYSDCASPQMNNQCVELSTPGAGCIVRYNQIAHLGADISGTSLFGVYGATGAAIEVYGNTISGFYNAVECRADASKVGYNTIERCFNSGVRVRDADNCIVEWNRISRVWNGLEYNGGAGAGLGGGLGSGVDILDISDAAGGNHVRWNQIDDCYQGVVSLADNTGGNWFYYNIVRRARVNGFNYQDKAGVGRLWNNTVIHQPYDSVLTAGHAFVVQSGGVATAASIRNNLASCDVASGNVQCINLGGTPGTNYLLVELDYNLWHVKNGAHVGSVSATNYDTLAAWQGALAGVSQVRFKEANTIVGDPVLDENGIPTALGIGNGSGVIATLDAYRKSVRNPPTRGAAEFLSGLRAA